MKFLKTTIILSTLIFLQACNAMKGQSDMENMLRLMQENNPSMYRQVMSSFIQSAKLGQIDEMMELTSLVTIQKLGLDELKSHYLKDTIPALRSCKSISEGGDVIHVSKSETGTGSGWVFRKICTFGEDKTVQLQFVVLKEDGNIVVSSVGLA